MSLNLYVLNLHNFEGEIDQIKIFQTYIKCLIGNYRNSFNT